MSKYNCPLCNFEFKTFAINCKDLPAKHSIPVLCEDCAEFSVMENGIIRKATDAELIGIKQSPAYKSFLQEVQTMLKARKN